MSSELPKAYNPKEIDEKWRIFWETHDFYNAQLNSSKPPFCITMPPPNVTGVLHMGHALVTTLQDILARFHRMKGCNVLWVPGTDHAGIATQTVVERNLKEKEGKRRTDLGREEFLKRVWSWKEENEANIINQLKRLGASCDWSRKCFTMDKKAIKAVNTMFKKLFDQGLIYRGDYLVNWDPKSETAIADDEVEYEECHSHLWYFKYPIKGSDNTLTIATTRPETMLGDTAVAVSPSDPRFQDLIGKTIILPLMNREIPIIADRRVDPEFGTGALKITPAHDPNDYEMGLEHNLPFITMMTPNGRVNENGGRFEGLTMEEAREAVVEAMKELKLLEKIEPHTHRVGFSYRSKAKIEPYMSKQWFVKMSHFQGLLRDVVNQNEVELIPENWKSTYFHWIDNLRDWCVSRQLWWGHQIPIWYNKEDPETLVCWDGEGLPPEVEKQPDLWERDSDVLDTWFSSALWPMTVLGWPEKTQEFETFYPNSVLVTGHDILFFWVARMLMMGKFATDSTPFPKVFLHGLIYGKSYWRKAPGESIHYVTGEERLEYDLGKPTPKDVESKWEKMSKSKGNVIDPLEIIESYGTDAMRMGLCSSPTQSREIDLDRRRFEEFKNFANKVWNGARFVLMNLEGLTAESFSSGLNPGLFTLEDKWILSSLNRIIEKVNTHLENYQFDQAALEAYDFFWKEFCAYYVEISKPTLFGKAGSEETRTNKQKILVIVLSNAIRLLHPMAPFITEELFNILKERLAGCTKAAQDPYTLETVQALQSDACITAPFPTLLQKADIDLEIEETFDLVGKVIYSIRNIRGEMNLPPSTATDVYFIGSKDDVKLQTIQANTSIITALVRTQEVSFKQEEPSIGFSSTGVLDSLKIMIPLPEELLLKEKGRLQKEQERIHKSLEKIRGQLSNRDFVERAPEALIAKQKDLLKQNENELQEVTKKLNSL